MLRQNIKKHIESMQTYYKKKTSEFDPMSLKNRMLLLEYIKQPLTSQMQEAERMGTLDIIGNE